MGKHAAACTSGQWFTRAQDALRTASNHCSWTMGLEQLTKVGCSTVCHTYSGHKAVYKKEGTA